MIRDFYFEAADGRKIDGYSVIHKFGKSTAEVDVDFELIIVKD